MNRTPKYLLTLITLIGIANNITAYEYDLSNMIGDPIIIKINKTASSDDTYQIVFPGETVKQVFPGISCLRSLAWTPLDTTKAGNYKGGTSLIDQKSGRIPAEKQREFGDNVAGKYIFFPMELTMLPNALFEETRKAAADLLKGIDAFACQTLTEVKDFLKMQSGMPNVGGGGSGGGTGGGTGGGSGSGSGGGGNTQKETDTTKTINILENIRSLINSVNLTAKTVEDTTTTPPSKTTIPATDTVERARIKDQIKVLTSATNKTLLEKIAKLTPIKIADLQNALSNQMAYDKALGHIEMALLSIISTPTKLDLNSSVIKTSLDMMYNPGSGSGSPSSDRSKCDFGLGAIGDASGILAEKTLCTHRPFIIYYKLDENDIPILMKNAHPTLGNLPVLQACTAAGQ